MKWEEILRRLVRDYVMPGFGAWIIWKQTQVATPNPYLGFLGFAIMFPAARSAIVTLLSSPGSPLPLPPPQEEQQSPSLSPGAEPDGDGNAGSK